MKTMLKGTQTQKIRFFSGENVPVEMHKVRMVSPINLIPVQQRLEAIQQAGYNTFLLKNRDVFLDMLTDSGVNAMSQAQYAAMLNADDSYAGSDTFYRLEAALKSFFGTEYFLPAHQGRACENIIANAFIKKGSVALMNYHFTTTKAHITRLGGKVVECVGDDALETESDNPFKGNVDIRKLEDAIAEHGAENVAFFRVEAGTNLIGGQPISLANIKQVSALCRKHGIMMLMDASLLADNLFFIKTKEVPEMSLAQIVKEIAGCMDLIYFSGRKLGCARGGGIVTSRKDLYDQMKGYVTLFEGFLTYGGMSVREMEALALGLMETLDIDFISQTPLFVEELGMELMENGIPVVTPFGGLGCHVNAGKFLDHIPRGEYPSGALAVAIYIVSGIRGMERGTMSEQRNEDGSEHLSDMELVRLAVPKRVFTLSHLKYAVDRIKWLFDNRHLIGGLEFDEEPDTMRFFFGTLRAKGNWPEQLAERFLQDMESGL